ncbi:carbohydrate ABC transporter permease [Naumannella cuiyingiana]|uniref:Multiple sugar transport system permease protein n=1 Tax=Naumannella cuiyingiana TaxID=1347891 RepID=A0A7Z0DAL3_9ACTN|nr:sugar ABC transporter permease [Naumannella cuiyingiana]NYI71773.1 multiple sugar transport system permease protein [Naumannella cuiyingiana]
MGIQATGALTAPDTGRAQPRPGPSGRGRPPARIGGRRRRTLVAWAFCLPFAVIFAFFMLVPIIGSFAMSFTDFTARDARSPFAVNFVGIEQYAILFTDERFLRSMFVTGTFVLVGIPVTMAIALTLALALNSGGGRVVAFFRVGFYAPVVTSIVAVAVAWRYILQPDGLLNSALALVGIQGPNWLNDTTWALPSLIALAVWRNVGTLMVIFLAGLQSIPEEVTEAALVDGAGPWARLSMITMPLLRPAMLLGAVMISVGFLQFFEEAYVMTQGGPLGATFSVAYYSFEQFGFGKYAQASAASYVLFLAIALLSLLQFKLLGTRED